MNHKRNYNKNDTFTRSFKQTKPKLLIPVGLVISKFISDKITNNAYINKSGKYCYEINVGSNIKNFENNEILVPNVKLYYSENSISIVANNIQMLANALDIILKFNDQLKGALNGIKEDTISIIIETNLSVQQYKQFSEQIKKLLLIVNHNFDNRNLTITGPKSQVKSVEKYYNEYYKDLYTFEIEFDYTNLQRFWAIQDKIDQNLLCVLKDKKYVQISGKEEDVLNAVAIFEQVLNSNKKNTVEKINVSTSVQKVDVKNEKSSIDFSFYESYQHEEVSEDSEVIEVQEEPMKMMNKDTAAPTGKGVKKFKGHVNKTKKLESNVYETNDLEAYAIVEKFIGNGYLSVKIVSSVNNGKTYSARICGSMRHKKHNKLKGSKIINVKDYVMVSFREFEDKADIIMKVPEHIISKFVPVEGANYNDIFDYSEDAIDNIDFIIEGI